MKNDTGKKIIIIITLLLYMLPIVVFGVLGTYSRALSDDYCDADRVNRLGFLGSALHHYLTFEGRFSTNIIKDFVIGWSQFAMIPFMPVIYLLLFVLGAFLTLYQVFYTIPQSARISYALLFALAILVVFLSVIPNINQSFFWAGAAIINFLPLIIFLFYCLLFVTWASKPANSDQKKPAAFHYALAFLIPFFAGGFTEVFAVLLAALFVLAILAVVLWVGKPGRKAYLIFFMLSLLGATTALALIVFAPGTAVRQAMYAARPNVIGLLRISATSLVSIFSNINRYPSKIISLLGLAALGAFGDVYLIKLGRRGSLSKTQLYLLLVLLPMIILGLMFACILPAAYGLSTGLPARTQSIPLFILVLGVLMWGFLWGMLHEQNLFTGVDRRVVAVYAVMFLLLLNSIPVLSAVTAWRDGAELRVIAAQWDAMHSQIMLARVGDASEVVVEPLIDWAGRDCLSPDPENWVNRCASRLYGITVRTE